MKVYKRLYITQNTIVPKGAVQETAIFKAEQGEQLYNLQLTDCVKNNEDMEMHSIMFMLNKADSQDCIVTDPNVLKEAAIWFNKHGKKELKYTHKGKDIPADVMCVWIVQKGDPIFPAEKYIGALASTAKFHDPEKWELVKSENWETSIEGKVEQIEENETEKEKTLFEKVVNHIKKHFELKKAEGEDMSPEEIKAYIDEKIKIMLDERMPKMVEEAEKKEEPKPEEKPAEKEVKTEKSEVAALSEEIKLLKNLIAKSKQTDEVKKENKELFL